MKEKKKTRGWTLPAKWELKRGYQRFEEEGKKNGGCEKGKEVEAELTGKKQHKTNNHQNRNNWRDTYILIHFGHERERERRMRAQRTNTEVPEGEKE